jgi:tubulin polyglutamylase TTLL6/13
LLRRQGHDVDGMIKKIKKIFIKTFCSVHPILSHHYRSCQPDNYANNMCFEVLGMDVIIDEHLKPYLLEVNHTPSFTTDTPLDSLIKKNVIKDAIILMNTNQKAKWEIVNSRKEIM